MKKSRTDLLQTIGIAGLLFTIFVPQVSAQLRLETEPPLTKTAPDARSIEVEAALFNPTGRAIAIREIKTCCECVDPVAPPDLVPPGGRVTVRLRFTPGRLSGRVERSATVVSEGEPVEIPLRFEVPEVARLEPERLFWKVGDPAEARTLRLASKQGGWKLKQARVTNTAFTVETIEELGEGEAAGYTVRVTPSTTELPAKSQLILTTDHPAPAWQRVVVPLEIGREVRAGE